MAIIKKRNGVIVHTQVQVVEAPTTQAMHEANVAEVKLLREKARLMEMLLKSLRALKHYREMADIYHQQGRYGMAELESAKAVSEVILVAQLRADLAKL